MPETPLVDQIKIGQAGAEPAKSLILDQSLREQDERAGERNKYRTLAQKLFGQGKVSNIDMAMEEAMSMDALIDQRVKEGAEMADAVKQVSAQPEFKLKGLRNIQKEEYVRAKTLQFAHALEENKFLKAKVLRKLPQLQVDDTTVEMYQDAVKSAINQRAGDLVTQKDGGNFRKVVRGFGDDIQRDRMQVTDEALKVPEIQVPIQKDLVASFKWHVADPEAFGKDRDKFVAMGILDAAEMNQLPEIQKVAKQRLVDSFKWHVADPKEFGKDREALVKLGIVSADEINQLAEVQDAAKQRLIGDFQWHVADPEEFGKKRDELAALGVVNVTEINKLEAIHTAARERMIGSFKWHVADPEAYAKERDILAQLGVVNASEINKLDAIQQAAKQRLIDSLKWHVADPENFVKERDVLVSMGIVDIQTVDVWIQEVAPRPESLVAS